MKQIIIAAIVLTVMSAISISCNKNNSEGPKDGVVYQQCAPDQNLSTSISFNGKSFNLDKFEQNLRQALNGKCIGYQYSISQGASILRSKGYGYARIPTEGNDLMSPCTRMNIASVSKTITAAATLKLLESKGISADDYIAQYLPADWIPGTGVNSITFRQLLSHNSGFQSTNMSFDTLLYDSLRNMVARGTGVNRGYLNANLALCRVLIPGLLTSDVSLLNESYCNSEYQKYVNKYILNPCGIDDAQFSTISGQVPVLMYKCDNGVAIGGGLNTDADGWFRRSGGGGWFLSAIDLNKFLNGIRYDDAVLSPANRAIMQTRTGATNLAPGTVHFSTGYNGTAYGHDGGIGYGSGQGFTTMIYQFPQNINAVLMINCLSDGAATVPAPFAQPTLINAYNAAWE